MATSSCSGGSFSKFDAKTLNFQATPNRMQELLAWYAKIATVASKTLPEKASTPPVIPPMLILTLVGCNTNPTKNDITLWIREAYIAASSFFKPDTDKGAFDIACPLRLVISWDGTQLGFRFEDNYKRVLNIVIFPEVCPLAGEEINTYCVEKDQWKTYTDGNCGQYYQLVKTNSEECGYVPPIPAGEKLETYCEGFDQWAYFSDGNYGKTPVQLHVLSEECGYVPPPPAGTVVGDKCKGFDLYDIVADGSGGTRDELNIPNSASCGYEAPPTGGELVEEYCMGLDKWGKYTDGNGGFTNTLISVNSTDCGYVPPSDAPNGQLLNKFCSGTTQMGRYANGQGGTYEEVIAHNSTECGYVAPPQPPNRTVAIYWQYGTNGDGQPIPNRGVIGNVVINRDPNAEFVDVTGFHPIRGDRPPEGWSDPIRYGSRYFWSQTLGRSEGDGVIQDRVMYPSSPSTDICRFLASQLSDEMFNAPDLIMYWTYQVRAAGS